MAKSKDIKPEIKTEKNKIKFLANCDYDFISAQKGDIVELEKEQAEFCLNRNKCKSVK